MYRSSVAKAISYFIRGVDMKNSRYLNAVESPMNSSMFDQAIFINTSYKLNGFDVTETGPFCSHT